MLDSEDAIETVSKALLKDIVLGKIMVEDRR